MIPYSVYEAALAAELLPAMGCTEPIALAYAAAICAKRLGGYPERIELDVSRNIVKNVKSVVVPNTGGLTGLEAAAVAGFVAAKPEAALEVLAAITPEERDRIREQLSTPDLPEEVEEEKPRRRRRSSVRDED